MLNGHIGQGAYDTSRGEAIAVIEEILREQVDLSKPDDLAYLESQIHYTASRIAARLGLPDGRAG